MILALSASFFACTDKTPEEEIVPSKGELALAIVDAAFPEEREDKAEIAAAFLALLERANLEDAEVIAVLSGLKGDETLATVSLDIKANSYTSNHADLYRDLLSAIATAVGSPEIAGRVFYTAASRYSEDLPFSLSDCEKLAPLILGQDLSLGGEVLDAILEGETESLNEKEINTMMLTLVSALRKAVGISPSAKEYLLSLVTNALDSLSAESGFGEELTQAIERNKQFYLTLTSAILEGYDEILSFAADYLDQADTRLFIGLPYEKEEHTIYYGYKYADWTMTVITKEAYDARSGGFDDYFEDDATVKGFTVNGTFVMITEEDAALADAAYRLYTAYLTYSALTPTKKQALESALTRIMEALSEEESEEPAATFGELLDAIAPLSAFDATDGITIEERNVAKNALQTFKSYLHGYLPSDY